MNHNDPTDSIRTEFYCPQGTIQSEYYLLFLESQVRDINRSFW